MPHCAILTTCPAPATLATVQLPGGLPPLRPTSCLCMEGCANIKRAFRFGLWCFTDTSKAFGVSQTLGKHPLPKPLPEPLGNILELDGHGVHGAEFRFWDSRDAPLSRHAAMQHSLKVELLQLGPASSCQVGCPLCVQPDASAWKDVLIIREHFGSAFGVSQTLVKRFFPKSIPEPLGNIWELGNHGVHGAEFRFWDSRNV